MYASIPAEDGWHVYLDGAEVETFALDDALLCFDIPAGEHVVEYRYEAPGFAAGIGITAAGAAALALYYLFPRFWKRLRKNK